MPLCPKEEVRKMVHDSKWLALTLAICAFGLVSGGIVLWTPEAQPAKQLKGTREENTPTAVPANAHPTATPWGLVPYREYPPENPIHKPRAEYLQIYWSDLKPTANASLTPDSVRAAIEKRLKRTLAAGPPVNIRFIATGDDERGPLPDWFKPEWKAPAKCQTKKGQQLPAWSDPAQILAHAEIVRALAAALDGDPQVAWIEPGSYGFYGEGHIDGAPAECVPSIETRIALAKPWVESFKQTPLSVLVAWMRPKDDPNHRLRDLWGSAASVGLRFDCLGFWQDEYASVIEPMAAEHLSGWTGPWGGEFCYSEPGAQWSMGLNKVDNVKEVIGGAPPDVRKMKGEARRNRVLAVVRDCGWSYVAGAGSSLLELTIEKGKLAQALEEAMSGPPRDLKKCAAAARAGNP
jgi:hypothetical protein